jgi:chitin disaccharide deacetylase
MASLFELIPDSTGLRFGDIEGVCRIGPQKKFLIITADDFGLDESVNEAVEQASRSGVLTAASLMVGAAAAVDAVRRARRLPRLRVGLHLVLADGVATLPHDRVPSITDANGYMNQSMFLKSFRFFAVPRVRRQLEAEIRAQFESFAATGLPLDHVNVHKHFHLHPTLLGMILRIGREFGVSAIRLPDEPWFAARSTGWPASASAALLRPWMALMKRRVRAAGWFHNDSVFGIAASGSMDEALLLDILQRLPAGVTEIYLHPATERGRPLTPSMSRYRHADELAGLLSSGVRDVIAALQIDVGGYADARLAGLAPRKAAVQARSS